MRAVAQIKDLNSDTCKRTIRRNLSRILDIRILDIDTESRTLTFLYENVMAFEKAKRELYNIGFSITQCTFEEPKQSAFESEYSENTAVL